MQEFLNVVLWPSLFAFLGILMNKGWDWLKPKFQTKIDNAEAKAKEIENEKSQLDLSKSLLEFAQAELDKAIDQIKKRDEIIQVQDKQIGDLKLELKERNQRFDELMEKNEHLIVELSKYKQLNGKI